jgi:hypothetical protein
MSGELLGRLQSYDEHLNVSTVYSLMPTVNCLQSYDEPLNVSTAYSHMPAENCLQSYATVKCLQSYAYSHMMSI